MCRAYRLLPATLAFRLPVFVIFWHEMRWYHLDIERATRDVAGEDQLQPVLVAATVRLRPASATVAFRVIWMGSGRCVSLPVGAAHAAIAGPEQGREQVQGYASGSMNRSAR
jgi:hypothetical protein